MAKRYKMSKRKSRKLFKKTAALTHKKNLRLSPMRGGFRI